MLGHHCNGKSQDRDLSCPRNRWLAIIWIIKTYTHMKDNCIQGFRIVAKMANTWSTRIYMLNGIYIRSAGIWYNVKLTNDRSAEAHWTWSIFISNQGHYASVKLWSQHCVQSRPNVDNMTIFGTRINISTPAHSHTHSITNAQLTHISHQENTF